MTSNSLPLSLTVLKDTIVHNLLRNLLSVEKVLSITKRIGSQLAIVSLANLVNIALPLLWLLLKATVRLVISAKLDRLKLNLK